MRKDLVPADLDKICSENTVVAYAYYLSHQKCLQALDNIDPTDMDYEVEVSYKRDEYQRHREEGYEEEKTIEQALDERFYPLGIVKPDGSFEFIGAFYDAFEGKYLTSMDTEDILTSLVPESFEEEEYEEDYYFDTAYGNYLPCENEVIVTVKVEVELGLDLDLECKQDYLDEEFERADKGLMKEISELFSDKDKAVRESEMTVKEMARATPLYKAEHPKEFKENVGRD